MRIIIGVDGSEAAEHACRFVAGRPWPATTTVELVAVHKGSADWTGMAPAVAWVDASEREALDFVLQERAVLIRQCGLRVETHLENGAAARVIMRRAEESHAQLIIVASRGLGPIAAAVLGSVSAELVDHAPCPVLVVRSPGASRMLLAADGTEASRTIPDVLAAWGQAFRDLPVEVLSVVPRISLLPRAGGSAVPTANPGYALHAAIADDLAAAMRDRGWRTGSIVSVGDPEREILSAAAACRADLIVTGSRGIGTLRRLLLGSVSHDVLMHGHSSLLVVRGHVPAPIREPVRMASNVRA